MTTLWFISTILLWLAVLGLGFLLLGTLRSLGLLNWRLDQLEATMPSRVGRSGLKPGTKALSFTLPSAAGGEVSLHDFVGRQLLLVFTQSGCGPCHDIVPELNRLQRNGEQQVLVVNNGDPETTRAWAGEVQPLFPILCQEQYSLSKRYEVFATPFAFLIDEQGFIVAKGIATSRQYLNYLLTRAPIAAQTVRLTGNNGAVASH